RSRTIDSRARFVQLGGRAAAAQPTILLAAEERRERRQWAVAHEIGEAAASPVTSTLGIDVREAGQSFRELVANHLAGRFLIPTRWFAAAGEACDWDLWELKRTFATASHELLARRMLEMPPRVVITLFDQGRLIWRKTNQAYRPPPLLAAERQAQRAAHLNGRLERPIMSQLVPDVGDIRAWPIHEPHWRREIVRTSTTDVW
ncbi:MAG: ImmA/IrrE family metallo-endopeptidase, partial [Planctomycetota bacterium]